MKLNSNLALAVAFALAVVLTASPSRAQSADPYAASTKTCQGVINDDVKSEYPKAKRIEWDMSSVSEREVKNGVRLTGEGSYVGGSDEKRTFEFDCEYDETRNRVVNAWWVSSFDRERHVVVGTYGSTSDEGPSPSEITVACRDAVDHQVREDFEHSIRKVELLRDSIERSESGDRMKLEGQGRFLGGGGNWHRFDFTCIYDQTDDEVMEVTWKHLGNEADLD